MRIERRFANTQGLQHVAREADATEGEIKIISGI